MRLKKTVTLLLTAAVLSSIAVTGCGSSIDPAAAAATLDDKEISMGVANFMAQYRAVQMDSLLSYYGEDMWTKDSGDGSTMTDSVKEQIMDNLQEYYLMDAHAADYNVALTDEEKAAITEAAAQFMADNEAGGAVKVMNATQENVEEMLRLYTIQSKMQAAIEETIDTNVSDEECAQKTFSYVTFQEEENTDEGTDTTADDTAADDEADPKAEAEAFLETAGKDMNAAAEAAEYTVSTCSYGAGDLNEDDNTTSMDVAVLKAADKLKDGELADAVVEADDVYYVIRMDSTDDKTAAETKKNSILEQRRSDKYDEVLKEYKDACKWEINEDEWDKVNFDELYTIKATEAATEPTAEPAEEAASEPAEEAASESAEEPASESAEEPASEAAE